MVSRPSMSTILRGDSEDGSDVPLFGGPGASKRRLNDKPKGSDRSPSRRKVIEETENDCSEVDDASGGGHAQSHCEEEVSDTTAASASCTEAGTSRSAGNFGVKIESTAISSSSPPLDHHTGTAFDGRAQQATQKKPPAAAAAKPHVLPAGGRNCVSPRTTIGEHGQASPPISGHRGESSSWGGPNTRAPSPAEHNARVASGRASRRPLFDGFEFIFPTTGEVVRRTKLLQKEIARLGGEVVTSLESCGGGGGGIDGGVGWNRRLKAEAIGRGGCGSGRGFDEPPQTGGRRTIAVATLDTFRTAEYTMAIAAGVHVVHPLYVEDCIQVNMRLDTTRYLLPLGRSALADHDLVFSRHAVHPVGGGGISDDGDDRASPRGPPRQQPFKGRRVVLSLASASCEATWAPVLRVAGAEVLTVGKKPGEAPRSERNATALESVLRDLKCGAIDCVVGHAWHVQDSSGRHISRKDAAGRASTAADRPETEASAGETMEQLLTAAREGGVVTGTLEWAKQCIVHGRVLSPDAAVCPWFPIRREACSGAPFFLHDQFDENAQYLVGDYVFLEMSGAPGRDDGAFAVATGGDSGAAAGPRRVGRVVSFHRGKYWEATALVVVMETVGEKSLIQGEAQEMVPVSALGGQAFVVGPQKMTDKQYALRDRSVLCLV